MKHAFPQKKEGALVSFSFSQALTVLVVGDLGLPNHFFDLSDLSVREYAGTMKYRRRVCDSGVPLPLPMLGVAPSPLY